MAVLKKDLQASTLIETIVAMVVLMVCIGIAAMIYVNVTKSGTSREKFHAYVLVNQVAAQSNLQKKYLDEQTEESGITMKKTIEKYGGMDKTFMMKITALDSKGKTLAERKEIINP
ncbi:MAG: hypothetical protein HY840_06525 [Bacteroidetes bacterium]|nr:hypothetical protein [Bacteroidota bacterium]